MDSIPIENINLEDNLEDTLDNVVENDEITHEELEFNKELKNIELELQKMDEQRKTFVKTSREKIRNYIKNGNDAIGYLPKYLKLSIYFEYDQFEVIDGQNTLTLITDCANVTECYEIEKLAIELCGAYLNIEVDISDFGGYIIEYSKK